MTPTQAAIINRVRAMVESGELVPGSGYGLYRDPASRAMRDIFVPGYTCEGCAIGALFFGSITDPEKMPHYHELDDRRMYRDLSSAFSAKTLHLIEVAYEADTAFNPLDLSVEEAEDAAQYGGRFEDDKERLEAILLCLERGDGEFKLPGPTDISTDGRTVWVNQPTCIGRFSPYGAEIHTCLSGGKQENLFLSQTDTTRADWLEFVAKMKQYHGIIIGEKYAPTHCKE